MATSTTMNNIEGNDNNNYYCHALMTLAIAFLFRNNSFIGFFFKNCSYITIVLKNVAPFELGSFGGR